MKPGLVRVRARQAAILFEPTVRAIAWTPLAAVTALAAATLVWPRFGEDLDPSFVVTLLRRAFAFMAMGLPFALDDPSEPSVDSTPTPFPFRRGLRIVLALGAASLIWALLLAYGGSRTDSPLPAGWLTLEAIAIVALGFALGGIVIRAGRTAGPSVAPAIFVIPWLLVLVPERWTFLGGAPGTDVWADAHLRWTALLIIASVIVVMISRDPAHRRMPRRSVNR